MFHDFLHATHKRLLVTTFFIMFLTLGIAIGYGWGIVSGVEGIEAYDISSSANATYEMSAKAASQYVNPFVYADAREVKFPVEQLKGCRNYTECFGLCADSENFPSCAAWARGEGLVK